MPKTGTGDVAVRQATPLPGLVLFRMLRLMIRVHRPLVGAGGPSHPPSRGDQHGPIPHPGVPKVGAEVRRRMSTQAPIRLTPVLHTCTIGLVWEINSVYI